jgi:hypothetical protein
MGAGPRPEGKPQSVLISGIIIAGIGEDNNQNPEKLLDAHRFTAASIYTTPAMRPKFGASRCTQLFCSTAPFLLRF